jgi:hypothetical protein
MSPWMLNVNADVTKAMQLQMKSRRVLIIPVSLELDNWHLSRRVPSPERIVVTSLEAEVKWISD